jgi:transglutaminase-like putative cysteine protease
MSMKVDEQVRQLAEAFDEFIADVTVDEAAERVSGAAPTDPLAHERARLSAPDNGRGGRRIGAAAAVLMVAGLLGALVWIDQGASDPTDATMPVADAEPPRDTASPSPASTVEVLSPLMDMRSLLTNRSDAEMFLVQADVESYWRLATLTRFDGTTWGLPESALAPADGELSGRRDADIEIRQEIQILGLDGQFVPAAADPIAASPQDGLRWNADAMTLLKTDGDLAPGDVYEIVSASPRFEVEDLRSATSTAPGDPAYLELPDGFPASISDVARQVTTGATTPFETALVLQDWFRNEFDYSLEVQAGHGNSAMEGFIRDRVGYAEQFAGTYAAMMRSLGIPTRVAVGFTPGVDDARGAVVFGKNAHAWPEVWFDDLGWVPFEPTPGRGAPSADTYTNVATQQSE